ncbi:Inactive pancreatic lipase-related protein 1 [Araneus ventricosus]|uniref:Inactive pancreatic lipase-related protein 1 n=1 Tax=Araneus ventricosus TaxID=182803 RepID=A0A4Y2FU84_ARAVE|nr:Inactive pancreatic lipase-related protein 1 [Araneus ventricosus]
MIMIWGWSFTFFSTGESGRLSGTKEEKRRQKIQVSSLIQKGLVVLQSEFVKKILQQDPAFCFRPSNTTGCNEVLLREGSPDQTIDIFDPTRKTLAFLFTPHNPRYPEYLHKCHYRLPNNTLFDPKLKTEVFIHGFLDGVCRSAWMREMKRELFKRGQYNVILVDWTWGNGPNYTDSAENTKLVGKQVAFLLQNIMEQSGVGPDNFHLVGHSFGAHIAGFAGKIVQNLRRITALDPALAPFQNMTRSEKLDPTDANLVDVIHTNGGTQVGVSLGDINPLGHVDFYPNGGTNQASCRQHIVKSYLSLDFLYGTISLVPRVCSHMHAVQYYKASINPRKCEFAGVECPDYESFLSGNCSSCQKSGQNCAVMGMNHEFYYRPSNKPLPLFRKFYLNTTILHPYCDNSILKLE